MRLHLVLGTAVIAMSLSTMGAVAYATNFTTGEFLSWSQVAWGDDPNPVDISGLLEARFGTLYASTGGLLQVGISGSPGFHFMEFDSADAVIAYLPQSGTPKALSADLLDPISFSTAEDLGGEVVALRLNIDFSAAGLLAHPAGVPFGSLVLTGLTGSLSSLNGLTVNDLLIQENLALGGAPSDFSDLDDAFLLANEVDMAFNGGIQVSTFGQQNLEIPVSTTPLPGALPLFATGLGAMGLLGWRRNRKNAAALKSA
jgi:hypothetical protein